MHKTIINYEYSKIKSIVDNSETYVPVIEQCLTVKQISYEKTNKFHDENNFYINVDILPW